MTAGMSPSLSSTPFSFSNENKLTVLGCDDVAYATRDNFYDSDSPDFISSCVAICSKPGDLSNGLCSGIGCCQASVPKGINSVYATMDTLNFHTRVHNLSSCATHFLQSRTATISTYLISSDSSLVSRVVETVPLVLDWAIGNQNCSQNNSGIICQTNSICVDSGTTLGGYRCNCSQGFQGNPYLAPGCKGLLVGFGLLFLLLVSLWLYKMKKKRRVELLKQNLFKRNGGLLLQQQMLAQDRVLEKMRIFTSKELEKATDRFNESRVLGPGGQGTDKGMLSDGRTVAVKRNVVLLLGYCLETEVPILVYEFIPNGTLYHLIHAHDTCIPFSWDIRLRITAEIANALACLHYATYVPIYHRDMKSTNILLDEKYRAKLSDFGISRSVSQDQTHMTTKVKGTFGYLDPEYFQTGLFTEKSDVYSFGVVLVELLTGQKPIATNTTKEEERSLISHFLLTMEQNQLNTILDSRV
ncbi:hypothetical protein C2S53_006576 [Perilla frutescens var. hirtella]|uniref:Protein kinase domain-containing protein n=1 Tax=Perilla frutescens var. hirtella TaxID=608512 RepID=A0AAD4JLT3_PERFH|nr:hypothetical protein C2S53_006576 [Perilla frutescens var. hirtella]